MNILNELRKKRGILQKEIAKELKISQQAYANYENGKRQPDIEMLSKIADYFGVSVDYLLGRTETMPKTKGVKIPVLGNVAAGIPIDAIEEIIDYEEIPEEMARNGEFFGLRINGDSMSPRIEIGDVVIVRKQSTVDNGDIAIVLINGDVASCKKIKFNDNGIFLISSNPAYEPIFFTKEECQTKPVQILGKVVELRGKF